MAAGVTRLSWCTVDIKRKSGWTLQLSFFCEWSGCLGRAGRPGTAAYLFRRLTAAVWWCQARSTSTSQQQWCQAGLAADWPWECWTHATAGGAGHVWDQRYCCFNSVIYLPLLVNYSWSYCLIFCWTGAQTSMSACMNINLSIIRLVTMSCKLCHIVFKLTVTRVFCLRFKTRFKTVILFWFITSTHCHWTGIALQLWAATGEFSIVLSKYERKTVL